MNSLIISPCKACIDRYGINDISSINDCCFNLCSTFVPLNTEYPGEILKSDCARQCLSCMEDVLKLNYKNPCQNWPPIPVVRDRPIYFQNCMNALGGDKEKARICCKEACNAGPNPNECKEWCDLAANAIIGKKEAMQMPFATSVTPTFSSSFSISLLIIFVLIVFFSFFFKKF